MRDIVTALRDYEAEIGGAARRAAEEIITLRAELEAVEKERDDLRAKADALIQAVRTTGMTSPQTCLALHALKERGPTCLRHPEPSQPRPLSEKVPTSSDVVCHCGGDDDDGHTRMEACP